MSSCPHMPILLALLGNISKLGRLDTVILCLKCILQRDLNSSTEKFLNIQYASPKQMCELLSEHPCVPDILTQHKELIGAYHMGMNHTLSLHNLRDQHELAMWKRFIGPLGILKQKNAKGLLETHSKYLNKIKIY